MGNGEYPRQLSSNAKGERTMRSELLNIAEAAELLRLKPSTLRAWVLRRRIPFVKLGRRIMFRRSDLDALITDSLIPARPNPRVTEFELQAEVRS